MSLVSCPKIFCVAFLVATAVGAKTEPATAAGTITSEVQACTVLKERTASIIDQNVAGPVTEWGCEVVPTEDFFVIALRAACHLPRGEICGSTLLGWYAVRRSTGQVSEWDMAEDRLGKPL